MDYFLLILGILSLIIGFVGCVIPILPGTPVSYLGLLFLHFSKFAEFSMATLIWLGLLTLIVQLMDFYVPIWGTKKFGGSKYATWGSAIGLIVGMFFLPAIGPFGIITILAGPFLGAYIGEKIGGKDTNSSLRSAFGSFIGFLAGTFMKLVTSSILTLYFVSALINYFKSL